MNYSRLVDLSVTTKQGINSDPEEFRPRLTYFDHKAGATALTQAFPGLKVDQLPGGEGWAVESVQLSTHSGTHMDSPYHYRSRMDDGQTSLTIDEVPLEWCIGRGVKLDFRHLEDGHVVTAAEIEGALRHIGHDLTDGDIVLVNTAAGMRYGEADFLDRGCGMGREATLWLTERGIRVVGTDAWSWDAPFSATRRRFAQTGDASLIWEGHFAGSVRPYCQIEKLANLDLLPSTGFTVVSLPCKVLKASGSWARPIALVD